MFDNIAYIWKFIDWICTAAQQKNTLCCLCKDQFSWVNNTIPNLPEMTMNQTKEGQMISPKYTVGFGSKFFATNFTH